MELNCSECAFVIWHSQTESKHSESCLFVLILTVTDNSLSLLDGTKLEEII
jgi:hypothetical protein